MNFRLKLQHFMLRHAMTTLLILTFTSLIIMLNKITISNKVMIDVLFEHDSKIYGYSNMSIQLSDDSIINIRFEKGEEVGFIVRKEQKYPSMTVLLLQPIDSAFVMESIETSPRLSGHYYNGETRLVDLVFSEWIKRW